VLCFCDDMVFNCSSGNQNNHIEHAGFNCDPGRKDNGTQHLLYFTECCLQNVVFTSIVMLNAIMVCVGHPCNALSPCQSDHFS
jgi:hypothetical protein